MSKLIEALRAQHYPDRTSRDLTYEYGQWLERNARDDIFTANPDFAEEYHVLKDEIDRARRPGYLEEFKGAFGAAVDEMQSSGYALGALAAHGARQIGIPGAEPVRNNLLRLMKEQEAEAAEYQPSVGSFDRISGEHPVEDAMRYATYGVGTVGPSIAQAVISATAGAAVGSSVGPEGTVAGAVLGLAERKLAQKALSKILESGAKNITLEQVARALPREAIAAEAKRLAVELGAKGALAASSIGSEVGSIYSDNPDAPGAALAFGIPAGLLDTIPESYILGKFFKPGAAVTQEAAAAARGYFRRFADEAFKTVPMEGSTEAAQTLLEIAAGKYGRGESPTAFTDADYMAAANAGIIGALGGGVMAPAAAFANPAGRMDTSGQLRDATIENLPLPDAAAREFPGAQEDAAIPDQDLVGWRTLPADVRRGFDEELRADSVPFSPIDEAPYAAVSGPPAGAPAAVSPDLPPSVLRAIEAVDEAVGQVAPVEFAASAPMPVAPPSNVVEDAPLSRLIGTQVEYEGYHGTLVRDELGNFMVLPPVRGSGEPFWIEIAGTGKDPGMMASTVSVRPLEPANMTPKPAPPLPAGPAAPSKVPLGDALPPVAAPAPVMASPAPVNPVVALAQPAGAPAAPPVGGSPEAASPGGGPAPAVAPTKQALPTGEQIIAGTGNGVPALPADSIPNMRRLRIFTQAAIAPAEDEPVPPGAMQPETVESQSVMENPLVELDKLVGKLGKSESNVAAVLVDNATGQAYIRGAYRGAGNTLYVDMASARKGTAVGRGSTVSPEADFARGDEGRPATKIFAEKLPNGMPRYSVYGVAELTQGGGPRNWNAGLAANLNLHAGIQSLAKRWWTDQAAARPQARAKLPAAKMDTLEFSEAMAAWRRVNPGTAAATEMGSRVREHAAAAAKGYGLPAEKVEAWAAEMARRIEDLAKIQTKQGVTLSADYTVPPRAALDLYRSNLQALVEGREVDVVGFEQSLMDAANSAAQTTGLVITGPQAQKIVAFGLSSIRGPVRADSILSLLHETAHVVTDGIAEPLRVAFQEAVERLPWQQQRWLMNPRSLDVRLLANADPAQLSPEQRAAIERLTAEEIAAAQRMPRADLAEERMVEHLAQLGWDRAEAKGAVAKLVRFVKELWLRFAMAIQRQLKGPSNVSPELARQYVENRYLQFIHRDAAFARDRINDLQTWLGVPRTSRQLVPVFPAGADWEMRMQYVDVATGDLVPVDHGTYTPESQLAYIKTSLDRAAAWASAHPADGPDTPDIRLTRRAYFSPSLSSTPTITLNTGFAALNLEAEIYRGLAVDPEVAPLLPRPGGQPIDQETFIREWLRVPSDQAPSARRTIAEGLAKQEDPLTGAPIEHNVGITVNELPSTAEVVRDREGVETAVHLSEAQDKALKQTLLSLRDTYRRLAAQIARDTERRESFERQRARQKENFPAADQYQLSELGESLVTRGRLAIALDREINKLLQKFRPGDIVNVFPGAELLSVPSSDATEAQIRSAKKYRVPVDLKFSDGSTRGALAAQLSTMEAWLLNAENIGKGQIYGVIAEQYRKLNQIPVGLERAGTAGLFRRSVTGGFADELRASGLPSLQALAKRFNGVAAFVNTYTADARILGNHWALAFREFAEAMGRPNDQAFVEEVWDPMMRVWNFVDVSERSKLATPDEGSVFATIERSFKGATGFELGDKQRAALRRLLMATIESERFNRQIFEQHPELKVHDRELNLYRRLITHGIVTGRRGLSRHIEALVLRMNPTWSDTRPVSEEDQRTFWQAAPSLYRSDRAAFDARMQELFGSYVVDDFVEPLVTNNVQIFSVAGESGPRLASLLSVRQAWAEAEGDVTKFAERLHVIEGGKVGEEASTVTLTLGALRERFGRLKHVVDERAGADQVGHEMLARQMLDGREADDMPAAWVSYATHEPESNLILVHQLAMQAQFGPDAIAANGDVAMTIHAAQRELTELYDRFDLMHREGLSQAQIERAMGKDDFAIARNAAKITANLDRVLTVFRQLQSVTNYLSGDFRALNDVLGLFSTMMLQNPRSAALNASDILGPLSTLKLSTPALRALKTQIGTLAAELGNSVLEAFGQNAAFNVSSAKRRLEAGAKDADSYVTWKEKSANVGPRAQLARPDEYEAPLTRAGRAVTRAARRGRDIIPNLGSPFAREGEERVAPKLRWGLFQTVTLSTMNANIDAAYQVFADLATRGVRYIQQIPTADRAQFVRELELGVRDLEADQLGYFGGIVLNDRAAFDSLKFGLETQMAGESGVGRFVAKAWRRQEAAGGGEWDVVSPSQFTDIVNYANSQWTLQGNFATLPHWMQHGPFRPLFIFMTWPYLAMRRFGRSFTDAEGRLVWWGANSTVADGLKAFFILAAPATIAGSFAVDWYDKYLLGKRQNLRETSWSTAVPVYGPVSDPLAFVERIGRYGGAGFASDIINQVVNYDTQRNLSLDSRIVAINAISNLISSLVSTPIQQSGEITYASVGRPFLQSIGGGGVLQYLQVAQNLLDLNTQDAAINARINVSNYLRAAGRELNLPVRAGGAPSEIPSRTRPYMQQMELAALVGNVELFRDAYRSAVQAARDDNKENPEKYVADGFNERHPLRRIFRVVPTEGEYRKLLAEMDPYGAKQVRAAINSYNGYLSTWFGKKPYYGKPERAAITAEDLLRDAHRINSEGSRREQSLIAIP